MSQDLPDYMKFAGFHEIRNKRPLARNGKAYVSILFVNSSNHNALAIRTWSAYSAADLHWGQSAMEVFLH